MTRPHLNHQGHKTELRHIAVDANGVPVERTIPIYNLAGVLAEHRRHLINRRCAA